MDTESAICGYNDGLFGVDEKIIAEWCLVDTENYFKFRGNKYLIDSILQEYKVSGDNESDMDKILCFYSYDRDKYFFFNQDIRDITEFISLMWFFWII